MFQSRAGHYLLLIVAWAAQSLVNLGGPSLWDIDEGNNATAAREMLESGNWIVPTFNYELRVDKPALLYWLQIAAYQTFGINEFSARLPSALAALLSVLLTYELARRMFGASVGLIAGLILVSTVLFCASAHFANPDALLNACTLLTLFLFWRDEESGGNSWLILTGVSSGLGMLAKGPVGVVLPAAVIGAYLVRQRQLRRYFHRWIGWGVLVFIVVAVPWYAWVGADTRGEFLRGFFLKHNVGRFLEPMENHRGPVVYYLGVLLVGFAPWSAFFLPAGWHAWKTVREAKNEGKPDPRYRFLGAWVFVYLVFFSLSRTKLPNYVLPLYPPLAIGVAHFLDRWRKGEAKLPSWAMHASMAGLCLVGVTTALGLLVGGGAFAESMTRGRHLPGLENWALVGALPMLAGLAGWWLWDRERRARVVAVVCVASVLFTGICAAWAHSAVDRCKAPRALAEELHRHLPLGDVEIACYRWFQPSVVFYCQRKVAKCQREEEVLDLLRYPIQVYLFLPLDEWGRLKPKLTGPARELGRQRDFYKNIDVVLVTNR